MPMNIFAISDPHLSIANPKPMDIFGCNWENHFETMSRHWKATVSKEDIVLIAGDISWAMKLEDALVDLQALGSLPGRKVILRGNHDYWWNSITRIRAALPVGMYALQNDSLMIEDVCICGSRGWLCPGSAAFCAQDEKIYDREVVRMGLSLVSMKSTGKLRIAMTHYPPFNERQEPSGFTQLFEQYGVDIALYGHLHSKSCWGAFEGERNGVIYKLTSCDFLDFNPLLIAQI